MESFDPYLSRLDEAQWLVVSYMYGMGGAPQLSLNETAEILVLKRAEVRRLHNLALESIRGAVVRAGGVFARAA